MATRPVTANATCGVGSSVQKEMYCKLGAGFDRQDLASSSKDIVDGQVTDPLCTTFEKSRVHLCRTGIVPDPAYIGSGAQVTVFGEK